jgi:hypothetical protein
MPCTVVNFDNGTRGFVCTSGPRFRLCACGSGKRATLLCDWKVPIRNSGTCDAPICPACTHVPAPDKDLCPPHAAEWAARRTITTKTP